MSPAPNEPRKSQRKSGFALIMVLGFAAVVAVFTAAIGSQAAFNLRIASSRGESDLASYASTTGTQLALSMLREPTDPDWLEYDGVLGVTMRATQSASIVHVYHNIGALSNAVEFAPPNVPRDEQTAIPPDNFYIISVGVVKPQYDENPSSPTFGDLTGGTEHQAVTMGSTLTSSFPLMANAVFGYEEVDIQGKIDHFDSRDGVPFAAHPKDGYPEASVATADTQASKITIGPTAEVDGYALLGDTATDPDLENLVNAIGPGRVAKSPKKNPNPKSAFGRSHQGPASNSTWTNGIGGAVGFLAAPQGLKDMVPDPNRVDQVLPAATYTTNLNLDEGKLYLQTGNLTFSGAGANFTVIDTNGDGEVEDVVLLVDGNIEFTNCTVGKDTPPRRVKIFSLDRVAPGTATITMTDSEVSALIGSNTAEATLTRAVHWGAILANKVTVDVDSTIHFDVAFRDPLLVADTFGYYIVGSVSSPGSSVGTGNLGQGNGPGATAPAAPATTSASAPALAPAPSGCGGCGCGGGSMMLGLKAREEVAAY